MLPDTATYWASLPPHYIRYIHITPHDINNIIAIINVSFIAAISLRRILHDTAYAIGHYDITPADALPRQPLPPLLFTLRPSFSYIRHYGLLLLMIHTARPLLTKAASYVID